MPKIVVKRKAEVYKEFSIRPFQSRITIGSEGDNDLIIADKKVSMHHLVIEKEGTRYFVRDTQSAFGSYLNGELITDRMPLSSGDEIKIGDHTLIFENVLFEKSASDFEEIPHLDLAAPTPGPSSPKAPALDTGGEIAETGDGVATMVVESEEVSKGTTAFAPPASEKLIPHYLLAIYGPYLGKIYRLNYGVTKIGRDSTLNDIVIRENEKNEVDPSISRRHATIFMENGKYYIMDKRSKTRTRVNRKQLGEEDVVQLYPNDEIEIVSDQKSTIFRFVPEVMMDFSPPKRCGSWWVRNSNWVVQIGTAIGVVLLLLLIINSISRLRVINQKPETLQLTEIPFIALPELTTPLLPVNQVLANMAGLAPAIGDFNGDGYVDVAYADQKGYLIVINGRSMKPLWNRPVAQQLQSGVSLVITDLNNNRLPDLLIPANNSTLYAIEGSSGNEIWTSPLLGGLFSGSPVVADLNGDGFQDVFIASQTGQVHIGYGSVGNPQWTSLQVEAEIRCTPSAGDVDRDGLPEVILGTENGKLLIFDGTSGNFSHIFDVNEEFQKAKGSFFEDHPIRQRVAIGDLDHDAYDDCVLLTEENHVLALSGNGLKRLWHDQLDAGSLRGAIAPPMIADLNDDGRLDVVILTSNNALIAYDGLGKGAGQKKILWGYLPENQEQFASYPVLIDINKDRIIDVLVAGFWRGLYIFNGKDGKLLRENTPIENVEQAIIGTPTVADFKRDKKLEILLRKNNDNFSLLQTNAQIMPGEILWGQLNFDAHHSGCNRLAKLSPSRYYVIILFSFLLSGVAIGYNIYSPLKRKKLFLKTP
ncbi:MAG: FHA domain-containing protein [candidate division KSB1 bacterium]|nr:FHA domain-containing protein [candidate division KSB1 bacterium]MDZ7358545.1 FHA domain-containing protein [candidate division KSB1 bacterium]MDZ7401514.1 FHA domain-containing protein [candidate division KSB1 bacterium]